MTSRSDSGSPFKDLRKYPRSFDLSKVQPQKIEQLAFIPICCFESSVLLIHSSCFPSPPYIIQLLSLVLPHFSSLLSFIPLLMLLPWSLSPLCHQLQCSHLQNLGFAAHMLQTTNTPGLLHQLEILICASFAPVCKAMVGSRSQQSWRTQTFIF